MIEVLIYLSLYFSGWLLLFAILGLTFGLGIFAEKSADQFNTPLIKNVIWKFFGYLIFLVLFGGTSLILMGKAGLLLVHMIGLFIALLNFFQHLTFKIIKFKSIELLLNKYTYLNYIILIPVCVLMPLYLSYKISFIALAILKPLIKQYS